MLFELMSTSHSFFSEIKSDTETLTIPKWALLYYQLTCSCYIPEWSPASLLLSLPAVFWRDSQTVLNFLLYFLLHLLLVLEFPSLPKLFSLTWLLRRSTHAVSITVAQSLQEHAEPTSIFYYSEPCLPTPRSPLPTELYYPECRSPSGPLHGVGGARPEKPAVRSPCTSVAPGVTPNLQVNADDSSPWQRRGEVTQPPDCPKDKERQVTKV